MENKPIHANNERPDNDPTGMYLSLRRRICGAESELEKLTARLDRLENRKPRTKGRGASPPNLSQQRKPKP